MNGRELCLDFARGFAILLVVVGHAIQASSSDFDNNYFFRLIYAFHMPLFFFLSGAVYSLKYDIFLTPEVKGFHISNALLKAAQRLLIPFVCWTILSGILIKIRGEGFFQYITNTLYSPDYSLWFLLTLFWCRSIEVLCNWGMSLGSLHNKIEQQSQIVSCFFAALVYGIVCIALFMTHIKFLGIPYIYKFFPFYISGLLGYKYLKSLIFDKKIIFLSIVVFMSLTPYWYRTRTGLIEVFFSQYIYTSLVSVLFYYIVAFAGIIFFMAAIEKYTEHHFVFFDKGIRYCSAASLGIYSVHQHLLHFPPPFLGTLLTSILFVHVARKKHLTKRLLLGER